MKKRALIVSGINWNEPWQRHHIITKTLIEDGYDVDFLQSVISSKLSIEKIKEKLFTKKLKNPINSHNTNDIPRNLKLITPPPFPFTPFTEKFYRNKISSKLRTKYDLIIVYIPRKGILDLIKNIKYKRLVYDCVRDFESWQGISKNIIKGEENILSLCSEIWCDSNWLELKLKEKLYKNKLKKPLIKIYPTIPDKILKNSNIQYKQKKLKRFLYFGTISSHVDIDILKELYNDNFEIHFIGKSQFILPDFIIQHGYIKDQISLLKSIQNLADAIIIPYKGNMNGVIPSKLNISLASGLPIFISEFYDSIVLSQNELTRQSIITYNSYNELKRKIKIFEANDDHQNRLIKASLFLDKNAESNFKKILL